MITRIQALNFKSLRFVNQDLLPFQVLVGPNASGKSTFFEVVTFLSEIASQRAGVREAVTRRSPDVRDLTFGRSERWFELAIEAGLPESVQRSFGTARWGGLRYEVRIGLNDSKELSRLNETLWLVPKSVLARSDDLTLRKLFPQPPEAPTTILWSRKNGTEGARKIVHYLPDTGNDFIQSETGKRRFTIRFGPLRSALANLPLDEAESPAGTWFRSFLVDGVQNLVLRSESMRKPSPPSASGRFLPDGSNLPWVVETFRTADSGRFHEWINHLRTALPQLETIRTVERPEDLHRYLILKFRSGLEVPSWLVSDGTLRLLTLTLIAYAPGMEKLFLVEEPENGIHPRAVETVFQSLASSYSAQIFLATHSPVILSVAKPENVLCFGLTEDGATDIVRGDRHPALAEWKGETDLGTLFASGVLG